MGRRKFDLVWVACFLLQIWKITGETAVKESKNKSNETEETKSEIPSNVAQNRQLYLRPPRDQIAIESDSSYQSIIPPPKHGKYGGNDHFLRPIPVPLPLPVRPSSIVLPSLPEKSKGVKPNYKDSHQQTHVHHHQDSQSYGGHENHVEIHDDGYVAQGGEHNVIAHAPPPIVHKKPSASPLTRSTNPIPVPQFSKNSDDFRQRPPPPQLPEQVYVESTHIEEVPQTNQQTINHVEDGLPKTFFNSPNNDIHGESQHTNIHSASHVEIHKAPNQEHFHFHNKPLPPDKGLSQVQNHVIHNVPNQERFQFHNKPISPDKGLSQVQNHALHNVPNQERFQFHNKPLPPDKGLSQVQNHVLHNVPNEQNFQILNLNDHNALNQDHYRIPPQHFHGISNQGQFPIQNIGLSQLQNQPHLQVPNQLHSAPSRLPISIESILPQNNQNDPPIDQKDFDSYNFGQESINHIHEVPLNSHQQRPVNLPLIQQPRPTFSSSKSKSKNEPWPLQTVDTPKISNINVKCEKNFMDVQIEFDRPFSGVIFSKGHFSNSNCVHLSPGSGTARASFDISINSCGTTGNSDLRGYNQDTQSKIGTYFENTLIIQFDPQVQEVWDQARKLRCTWHDQYEKSVTFKPFPVDMLDVIRADFAGDNVGCWMQIQVGKGPWASEVTGLVKIGQTMTMVLAIKDDNNKFDMLVRNCKAHDGKRAPIQLVDERGCVTRPKIMSRFSKIKNFGASASVLSYAHFQAFKFPDSMEVHFQCTIQICRYQCPEQCSDGLNELGVGLDQTYDSDLLPRENQIRKKRATNDTVEEKNIGVDRIIQVVSTRDLSFLLDKSELLQELKDSGDSTLVSDDNPLSLICMSTPGFAATLVVLLSILIISCLLSAFLCLRFRVQPDTQSIISSSYQNPAFNLHIRRFF